MLATKVPVVRATPADVMQLATEAGPAPMQVGGVLVLRPGVGFSVERARRVLGERIPEVGDELPMGPGRPVMTVEVADPPRTLAIRIADQNWVWIFALLPEGG